MSKLQCAQSMLLSSLEPIGDEMLKSTRALAEVNSGSYHRPGLIKVQQQLDQLFGSFCDVQHLDLAPISQIADNGTISQYQPPPASLYRCNRNAKFQLLCTGHSDTVFPQESLFQKTWVEGAHLRGPGVADMKGGLMVLYQALKAIRKSTFSNQVGFSVLISPDEEIGSPSSAKLLQHLAPQANVGLVYEPSFEDGTMAGVRKGSGNFSVVIKGLASHAGRNYYDGKNAILAAAELALRLVKLNNKDQGITVNIGKISGGGAVNIVPDNTVLKFNIRISQHKQQAQISADISKIIAQTSVISDCKIELYGKFNRPPKVANPGQSALQQRLTQCASQLGLALNYHATGGCCEGNNLAAAGLVNIDTLGVRGGDIHSEREYSCIDSFIERAQLSALLISDLCQNPVATPTC